MRGVIVLPKVVEICVCMGVTVLPKVVEICVCMGHCSAKSG